MTNGHNISLLDVVLSLSAALDLISPVLTHHHRRVAYLASAIARECGCLLHQRHDITLAGLLHDVGALSLKERINTLDFELDRPHDHAERGHLLMKTFAPLLPVAEMVRHHHVPWESGAGNTFHGEPVALESHILHLADRITVLLDEHQPVLNQIDAIKTIVHQNSDSMFHPDVVQSFMNLADREYIWLELTSGTIDSYIQSQLDDYRIQSPTGSLLELSKLFSRIIDFRSSFTALHSSGVAAVAERIASLHGLGKDECSMLRISGNLHDLGKLSIPREVLEKRAPLSPADRNAIKTHAYYTYQALAPLKGLEKIREWAAFHHERPDGTGYPFHVMGNSFDTGCRIVAMADVFTALTENRPYRQGMEKTSARQELARMSGLNQLDKRLMSSITDCYDDLNSTCLGAKEQALSEYLKFRGTFDSWSRQGRA